MIDKEKLIKDIRSYADLKCANGEIEIANGILKTLSIIEAQPNVDNWIPVSEKLPEESDAYLATFEEKGSRYVERLYYSVFIGWMMPITWQDEGRIDCIIAWMPLPEPWKE